MAKHKGTEISVPSKAKMAHDEIRYRAEQMARDAMMKMPQFKAATKVAMQHIQEGEKAAMAAMKKPSQAFHPKKRV